MGEDYGTDLALVKRDLEHLLDVTEETRTAALEHAVCAERQTHLWEANRADHERTLAAIQTNQSAIQTNQDAIQENKLSLVKILAWGSGGGGLAVIAIEAIKALVAAISS